MKDITVEQVMKLRDRAKNGGEAGTYWLELETIENKLFAIVAAIRAPYEDGRPRVMMKIAYNDSYMKEYDIDWLMPWDDKGVWDTEAEVKDEDDARFLLEEAPRILGWYKRIHSITD